MGRLSKEKRKQARAAQNNQKQVPGGTMLSLAELGEMNEQEKEKEEVFERPQIGEALQLIDALLAETEPRKGCTCG